MDAESAPLITSVTADPSRLWPPDNRMVPVHLAVDVTDNLDPAPSCAITSVTHNEAADPSSDFVLTGALTLTLRAQREGSGAGRTYTIAIECSDDAGNAATSQLMVLVPHAVVP